MTDVPLQVTAHKYVGIVPHTHWDREWYAPFQRYRVQLVHLVDDLLDLLETDPSFPRFLLDGQTAVVDDYLEVRPESEERLCALTRAGRLQVGPWMILMDEFMVSGETIVRNLQLGLARASALSGTSQEEAAAMRVGYLPDMFGHIAQMPQLLRLAGLEHAVVWRGVPEAVDQTAFWWRAPDGSTVRAEYLYGSYSNGRDIPRDPVQLVARARGYEAELGTAALPGGGMLLMNGSDHLLPQPWLGDVVAAANDLQDDYCFGVTSLGGVREGTTLRRLDHVGRRAALRGEGQPAHGRGVEPRRRAPARGTRRTQPRALRRTALGAAACRRRPPRRRSSTSVGASSSSTARTTRRARAAPTTWSRRCGCATRRRATWARR